MFWAMKKENIPKEMECLQEQQQKYSKSNLKLHGLKPQVINTPKEIRQPQQIIRLYIDLYTKNPHVLDPLRQFIKLPSNKTIRKVAMSMSTFIARFINPFCCCALELVISPYIHFYKIFRKNLEMVMRNGKHKFAAFVELGEAHDHMEKLMGEVCNAKPSLATRVLQFIFPSDCGFRFPIAQFPSGHFSPTDIYLSFGREYRR
ncbi:unnamed protein product [Pocillopora meandrina]|uniref:Uncharacterized protein n=1 Tax=Pocillopora meandrina TaxID=46732 RepID=A0AAU9VZT1_9CNID|nr:unnamed protein product [Pocillopora meandrina]